MARPLVIVLLAGLATSLLATEPLRSATPADAPGEQVTVRRVHWPVRVEPTGPRGGARTECTDLALDQIEVREDGQVRPVVALGARPQPRMHALLIDTSHSMRPKLADATAAAGRYLDSLPSDEPVLLATFDDNLVLRVPPTLDRDALRAGLDGLRTGNMTALWDALSYLVRYLRPVDAEKVIVLISDGADSASLERHPPERVLDLARATPDLTVFVVGIDLRASGATGFSLARHQLAAIARQTGGEFYEPGSAARMSGIFDSVRRRMEARRYVSYIPAPFGAGARDGGGSEAFRWRKVRVRASPDAPCRVLSEGAPRRLERRRSRGGLEIGPPSDAGELMTSSAFGACGPTVDADSIVETLHLPNDFPWRGDAERDAYICPLRVGRAFVGWTTDIVLERGPLFSTRGATGLRHPRASRDREPVFLARGFRVEAPRVQRLRAELSSPAELLRYLLEREECAPQPGEEHPYARSALFVHGQTFFQLRALIGRAFYATYADYATWAAEKAGEAIEAAWPQWIESLPGGDKLSPERRRALRDAIVARESDPGLGTAHNRLAEWLGDVDAVDAALELERRVMNEMLAASGDTADERSGRVAESWHRLARWFPRATQVRIVTPLVPVHDPVRKRIGFYRFLLPAPTLSRPRAERLPPRPLGLLALRSLVAAPEIGPILRSATLEVSSLRYHAVKKGELERIGCRPDRRLKRREVEKVAIDLRDREQESSGFRLAAFFAPPRGGSEAHVLPSRPLCLAVEALDGAGPGPVGRVLASALSDVPPTPLEP